MNSNKLWIIFKREFMTRVKNKLFLVTTLATPLLFLVLMIVPTLIGKYSKTETYTVHVIDPSKRILPELAQKSDETMKFVPATMGLEELKKWLVGKEHDAGLMLQDDLGKEKVNVVFQASQLPSMTFESNLKSKIDPILKNIKLQDAGLGTEKIKETEYRLAVQTIKITEKGEEGGSSALGFAFGYGMAFLTFMMVFIYGGILMKGVMEEKANRIVEIIISSVKPIELMLGKILGIGAVGLVQFLIWVVLIMGGVVLLSFFAGSEAVQSSATQSMMGSSEESVQMADKMMKAVGQFKFSLIFFFIFYFLGGYLIYGTIFAAIGAAIDQEADAGPLTTAISIPAYIPILLLFAVMNNPNGALAFWLSIIPFTSPTIMMARMAIVDVPVWQIILSMVLLVAGIYGMAWVSARIYRIGLLMYGKKITFKELIKWVRMG